MSKTKDVAVVEPQETAVGDAAPTFAPINDVPDKAPAPQVDWTNPNLSYDDVLPSNYFSMEELELWLEERNAESRILTVTGCTVEFVWDPEKGEATGDYKPCLSFEETATMLVINKTRGMQLKKLTRSPFLRDWAKVGQIAIKPGIGNGKAQIIITAVPGSSPVPANGSGKVWKEHTGDEIDEMFSYGDK
jgi:hypothetical protein